MTDTIGPLEVQRIFGFNKGGRLYVLTGDMADEDDMTVLEELIRDADNGAALHRIPAGRTLGEDMTENDLFTWFCFFDDESLKDGWYLIMTPVDRSENGPTFKEWRFEAFYMGTSKQFSWGLEVRALGSTTNDWGK